MKKRIIVDIDDTVASLHPVINALCNDAAGVNLAAAEWTTYDATVLYGMSNQQYTDLIIQHRALEEAHPIGRAMKTLWMFEEQGYHIDWVTARGWHHNGKALTKAWLNKWNFPAGKLHVVPLFQCKAEYSTANIAKTVNIVVDDSPTHIIQFLKRDAARKVFLIDRPWNRKFTELDPYRIGHISEVLKHL
jgi:uncharacterized HAD superfamily protein